jgi:hypothetical protein
VPTPFRNVFVFNEPQRMLSELLSTVSSPVLECQRALEVRAEPQSAAMQPLFPDLVYWLDNSIDPVSRDRMLQ